MVPYLDLSGAGLLGDIEVVFIFYSIGQLVYENHLEGSFEVFVRCIFCHCRCELVFFLVSHCSSFSILRVYNDVARNFGNTWFYTFCIIFSLPLFWIHQEIAIQYCKMPPNLTLPVRFRRDRVSI